MSEILMIDKRTSELIINDKGIAILTKRLNDFLCFSSKVIYSYDILEGSFKRVFSKEQISIIDRIEELIDLRKRQIIKANETTILNTA